MVQIPENGCIHLPLDVNDFVKEFNKNEIYIEMQLVDNESNSVLIERIQYLDYWCHLQKCDLPQGTVEHFENGTNNL